MVERSRITHYDLLLRSPDTPSSLFSQRLTKLLPHDFTYFIFVKMQGLYLVICFKILWAMFVFFKLWFSYFTIVLTFNHHLLTGKSKILN